MRLVLILFYLNFSTLFAQIDSLEMTIDQFNEFQSSMSKLESILLSEEHVYLENTRFDSLIQVAKNFDRRKEYEKVRKAYLDAKEIYPTSCLILHRLNPLACGCMYDDYRVSKFKETLKAEAELIKTFQNDECRECYTVLVDQYLFRISYLDSYYDANLECRVWVSNYIDELRNVEIVVK